MTVVVVRVVAVVVTVVISAILRQTRLFTNSKYDANYIVLSKVDNIK